MNAILRDFSKNIFGSYPRVAVGKLPFTPSENRDVMMESTLCELI